MQRDFATRIAGGAFLVAAGLLWGGWMLMPVHLGNFLRPEDFSAIGAQWHLWIWMFRFHLFGLVIAMMALVALSTLVSESPSRVLVWPGVAVAGVGLIVSALAAAFYYHFGAWGALDMKGKPPDQIRSFVDSLRPLTEYVTCLVRFGRVFGGLGLFVASLGLWRWRVLPPLLCGAAAALGVAAMALTMAFPDYLSLYQPVFHLQSLWLAATGVVLFRRGVPASQP